MLRFASAVAVLAVALPAWSAPPGRVIRVPHARAAPVPRICAMTPGRDQGMCFGQPVAGDRVALVDPLAKDILGEFVIDAVGEPTDLGHRQCLSASLYPIKGTFLDEHHAARNAIGLRGLAINRRHAKVLPNPPPPSGRPDEEVKLTLDANGDGRADVIVTQYMCDDAGAPTTSDLAICFDTYTELRGGKLQRLQQDILKPCQ